MSYSAHHRAPRPSRYGRGHGLILAVAGLYLLAVAVVTML